MTTTQKKQVSAEEFEKQVEIEAANLQHYEYMDAELSKKKARETVKELFEVV